MPRYKRNSFADIVLDWENLAAAMREHATLLPGTDSFRNDLEVLLAQAKGFKVRQEVHAGQRQKLTQDITQLVLTGIELTRNIRSIVRGLLGAKSELLVHFKVSPLRKRSRTSSQPPEEFPEEAAS